MVAEMLGFVIVVISAGHGGGNCGHGGLSSGGCDGRWSGFGCS